MDTIDFNDFQNLLNGPMGAYYTDRWEYFIWQFP
jgi:hypothetical protein